MNLNDAYRAALTAAPCDIHTLDDAILRATDHTLDLPRYDLPQYLRGKSVGIEVALDPQTQEFYCVEDPSVRSGDAEDFLAAVCTDVARLGALSFEALARKAWAASGLGVCGREISLLDDALTAVAVGDSEDRFDIPWHQTPTEIQLRAGEVRTVKYADGAFVCEEEDVSSARLHDFLTTLAEKIAAGRAVSGAARSRLRAALRRRGVSAEQLDAIERGEEE